MIELVLNHPIDYEILKNLYADKDDLQKAWPGAKYPLCVNEWNNFLSTSEKYVSLLYICFVNLDKTHRGQGIIYEMLRLAEKHAREHFSFDRLWLHVDPENHPPIKAYEKLGYKLDSITEAGRYRMFKPIKD
jgi:ribosomal protein S18 acetylase RimI-like enzyme